MARIKVQGTQAFVRAVRRLGDAMLQPLGEACAAEARDVVAESKADVPVDTGALRDSAFTDGPVVNRAKHSVTATGGYAHEFAGPIHEGVHGSVLVKPAPKFLKKAARISRKRLAQRAAAAAKSTLSQHTKR